MIEVHPSALCESRDVGEGTRVGAFARVAAKATIGVQCDIGDYALIDDGVTLGDRVSVGAGVTIGARAVVEPGAVVTKSVPRHAIVRGSPARIVGYVDLLQREAPLVQPAQRHAITETNVEGVTLHELLLVHDMRGRLSAGEFERQVPFAARRYFIVFDVPSEDARGEHAHRRCHQFLLCVRGRCRVVVDDGRNRAEIVLDRPDLGLYLPPMVWCIQYQHTADALLLVFASDYYDAADYIRDYGEFLDAVQAKERSAG